MGRSARELRTDFYQDHPGYGLTPRRIVDIYRLAEYGYPQQQCDLFDDVIENDAHLRNLLEQRCQAVAGKPYVIQSGGASEQDQLAALVLAKALETLPMIEVWEHQLSFNRYGWGASEIDWGVATIDGRDWVVPVWLANVPARRFRIDDRDQLRLLTRDFANDGEPLAPGKWLLTRRSGGKLARQALMRTATWFAMFKRNTSADWFIFAQKFGIPLVLAKYPVEGDEKSKDVAVEIVENVSEDGGAIIPKDFEVEIVSEGRDADSSGTHGGLISYCNRENSKLINGSTLSNDNGDSGGASYALGDVHDAVRWECVQYDAERLQEAFRTQVAAAFLRFNALEGVAPPRLRFQVVRDLQPRQRAEIADIMVNKLRIPISRSQLQQELGFRDPVNPEDAIEPAPIAAPAAGGEAEAA
jgi:phage gp29-like protein